MRYFKRNIESVIKVQCWFRGRLGYNLVSILRRERWASRKLRHWARCRLRKRNVMARRIQRWWWKLKRFRLLRHLWTVAKNRDYSTRKRRAEEKYQAACKIQALVRGIWDRRWVRRHRAALLIQKNLKFFFGLKKWKMMKREKNLKTVRKFVNKCIDQALQNQTIRIVQFHNTIIRKVQALVRRFLVRCVFMKSQKRAYQVGLAVVKIQRSWRKSGEISKAVEEVLARKRAESNPFKDCFFFHDLLMILRKECKPYYYPYDPRVGMKISTFLYRLGMIEIMDLFPKRNYVYALDLQKITLEKLNEMYTLTQNRPTRKNEKRKQLPLILQPNGANGGGGGGKKKTGPPTALFQLLLEILNITAGTRKPNSLQKLRFYLLPITDYMTANEAFIQIRKLYLKKFGKHVQTRATNVSRDIVEMCYNNYHHYQINNTLIPSLGFLQYIINLTQENTNVIPNLQEMQQFYQQHYLQDEKKWELERMKHSAQLLQLAVDRSLEILPKRSFIRNQIDVVLNRVITYKRKAAYILKKLQEEAAALAASNKKSGKGKNKSTIGKKPRSPGSNGTSTGQIEQKKRSPKASDNSNKLNQDDSLEVLQSEILPAAQIHLKRHPEDLIIDTNAMVYDGDDLTDYELDFQYNLTKSYGAVLFRMYRLTMGIQSIKNHWSNQALHRAMILEKRNQFLESMTQKYIEEQAENHVYKLWLKMRKLEIAAKKTENIIQAIRERKEWIEEQLQYVLRYHIGMYQDDFGYYYYVDEWYNSSYDPPLYSYEQWINVEKIQRRAKKYIVGARARRIAKEEEERRIIALQEALMLEERKQSLKAITARIFVKSFAAMMVEKMFLRRPNRGRPTSTLTSRRQRRPGSVLGGTATRLLEDDVKENLLVSEDPLYQNILSQIDLTTIDEHLDAMIPHKYRFDYTIHPKSGIWGLYYTPTNKEPILGQKIGTYQVVILFKIRKQEGLCDIRTVKGNIINNVSLKRIRHVQYSIGTKVECRYKYRKLFYRAVIIKIHDRRHLSGYENQFVTYSVRYEDGEVEHKLQRDAIRPVASSTEEFKKWHDEREFHLQTARRIYRRKMFFKLQKQQRMKDLIELHSHSFAMMDAKTLSPPSTSTALIPLNEDNTEGTVENSHPEVEEMFSTPLKGSADDEGMPTATSPEVTGHEIDNENHSHQSESTVSPTQLEKRLVTISPSSMPIAVSGSNSKVVIPVVRVRIKYTRQTPRYPWQIISQPQTRAQREENYPTVFFNPHTEEESEDMDQTLYAAKELHVIKKIQMRWLVFRAIKKLQRKTMSMDLRSIIVNTIEKGRKIAYVGYKLEGLTPMQILARAGYFELAEIITDYYQKVLQKTMSNLTIEEIAVNMVTKELYEKHLGILQTNHVRDLKEFQTWWKKTSPFERESKLGLFNYYTSTRDPRSLKQCINDSLELFVKKFSKYLKTSSTKTKKSCQMIIEASDFPHSHLQVETYLRRYSDKPELAREFVMELVNKPTVNTYVDEGKVLKMYYHVALQVSKILAVYKLKNVRAIVLDALRRVEEIMKDIVKINQRYNSSSGTGEEALPLTTATGDRVKGRPMHSGPEAKAAWIIREEIFQYLLILIQATTRIQCRWKAYSYRQRWKLFLTSRIAAIDKIQRCVRRYSAYKIARYYRGQRDSPWEQLWNSQYNLLYYYNFVTGQSQYFEPTTGLYRPLIRDKRSAQLIQAWPELDDIRSMIYQEMMQARAPYEKGNAGSKSYYKSKHTLPVMSKTVAQDLGMLAEIPANLLCIICQTRRVIRYCLNCSYDMITLMNKTRKTASSPSRGNRLSSASLTSSDGRRSSLSAGSSRHGGHEYMMPSSLGRFQKPVPYCLPCFLKEHHEDDEEKFNHKFLLAVNTLPPVEGGTTAVIPLPSATSPGRAASPQPLLLEDGSSLEGSLEEQSSDITIPITMTAMVPYGGKPSTANSTASSVVAAAATSLLPHSNLLYLKCCMCDRPATRKCQGLLHDEDINSLLAQLKKCPKSEWKKVIKPFTSLTSEKKLLLLIEQIIQQDDSEEVTTDLHDDSSHHSDPYRVKAGGDNHSVHSRDTTSSSYYNTLSPNQLQQIKYALEKLRHECDECYCTSCYQIVHSGGKRQYHTWKGFQEYARVCSVCQANPSELSCLDCISAVTQHLPPSMDSTKAANQLLGNHLNDNGMMMSVRDNKRGVDYCTACFHVYHTIGRKKRHRKEVVYEKYANDPNYYFDGLDMIKEEDEQGEITLNQDIPADDYCTLCLRRLGKKCQHDECQTIVCDECFEFKHKKRCKHRPHTLVTQGGSSRKLTLSPSSRNLYGGDGDVKADQGMSKSMGAKNSKKIGDKTVEEQICVVCGEIADKKCVQCGDFYCSRVWMGNPGCFIQYHSKGNRATHQTQSLSEANQKTFISFSSLLEQGKLNIKPGKSFNLNN